MEMLRRLEANGLAVLGCDPNDYSEEPGACNDSGCEGEASHEFNGGIYCFDCWCEMTGEERG
jgi:hypothetical protein